jgi:hypothetical protein
MRLRLVGTLGLMLRIAGCPSTWLRSGHRSADSRPVSPSSSRDRSVRRGLCRRRLRSRSFLRCARRGLGTNGEPARLRVHLRARAPRRRKRDLLLAAGRAVLLPVMDRSGNTPPRVRRTAWTRSHGAVTVPPRGQKARASSLDLTVRLDCGVPAMSQPDPSRANDSVRAARPRLPSPHVSSQHSRSL